MSPNSASPANLASSKGAYVLLVRISEALTIKLKGKDVMLASGTYAYCGSARGPGGLAARVERHRRRDKKVHWHIDHVTTRVPVLDARVSTTLSECELVNLLLKVKGTTIPVPGFGSSDCRSCASHFVKIRSRKAFDALGLEAI